MCNLYAVTKGQQAIRDLTRAMTDRTGNLPPLPGIYPDYPAPIVRQGRPRRAGHGHRRKGLPRETALLSRLQALLSVGIADWRLKRPMV